MGNSSGSTTAEQNEAASAEALAIFRQLGIDIENGITQAEWDKAFEVLDTDGDGSISRKEWFIKRGTTLMYDAFPKKQLASISNAEWSQAFISLDVDQDGKVSAEEWLRRRKVRLAFYPLGMVGYSWGVGVGEDFFEVFSLGRTNTEMAVVGPQGVIALGEFAAEEEARKRWLQAAQDTVGSGSRNATTWLQEAGEPRSRLESHWESFEQAGWTMRNNEQIAVWIKQWVEENPSYRAIDPLGRECNEQTFSLAFISWLVGNEYKRITDNTKGRLLVYGGLTILAGVGIAVAAKALSKPAEEPKALPAPAARKSLRDKQVASNDSMEET